MIKISEKSLCYGCEACASICPLDCISMVEDEEGFRYPEIDHARCVECGLCEHVCPKPRPVEELTPPRAYAAYAIDHELRLGSASGGVFSVLAADVVRNGGIVFGAVAKDAERAVHVGASTPQELAPMRNSKYVQSEIGLSYRQAKAELDRGRCVLFSGTPCQTAGLLSYLGEDPEHLLTCDLLCHGVPSARVYRSYLEMKRMELGSAVVSRMRTKREGWRPVQFLLKLADGREILDAYSASNYRKAYLMNLFQRPSCYRCPFASIPRTADISVGDYFSYRDKLENKGTSIVTVNTRKGVTAFATIRTAVWARECFMKEAVADNEHLARAPQGNVFRESFFSRMERAGLAEALNRYVHPNAALRIRRRMFTLGVRVKEALKNARKTTRVHDKDIA